MAQEAQRGRVVGGRYRLVKTLHTGGFGRVWQACDERLHADVAVKEVWLPGSLSAAERADRLVRAEREARNAARLRHHPNIVAVRDVVTEDGVPWIVMRLVTGHSLAQDLAASGPLSPTQVVYVADCLLKALGAAHAAGIVHRDVKPANVMFTETGEVLLTDFGIAVQEADTTLTATGTLVGSMDYIAPERIRGQDGQAAGDLFSLGVTLYQAVTGVTPFHRDTVAASLAAILFDQPPRPACPPELATLIMRLLVKDPGQRPTVPLARGLLAALPVTATSVPVRAAPAPAPRPTLVQTKIAPAAPKKAVAPKTAVAPKRAAAPKKAKARKQPASIPAPPFRVPPPRQPMPRLAVAPVRPPQFQPSPVRHQRYRRARRGSGLSILALIALGLYGAHVAWGRDASDATAGDCVYQHQQNWHLEPRSLPPPWPNAANYQVLARLAGSPAACGTTAGWAIDDTVLRLPGEPLTVLCLAPMR